MRLRLLRRRLTISSPRMAVRSALPWPFRWVLIAVVFGFCAAIALWAFQFGKMIAGIDGNDQEQVSRLESDLAKARQQLDQAQSIANTAQTLLTAEKAAQEQLVAQKKTLEAQNQALQDDLGFFEKLVSGGGAEGIGIRGLQAEVQDDGRVRWRILMIRPEKNVAEFQGSLEISLSGTLNGKPWSVTAAQASQAIRFGQVGRFQGVIDLPAHAVVKNLSARVLEGTQVRATHSVRL
jgi:hypothetical protein